MIHHHFERRTTQQWLKVRGSTPLYKYLWFPHVHYFSLNRVVIYSPGHTGRWGNKQANLMASVASVRGMIMMDKADIIYQKVYVMYKHETPACQSENISSRPCCRHNKGMANYRTFKYLEKQSTKVYGVL